MVEEVNEWGLCVFVCVYVHFIFLSCFPQIYSNKSNKQFPAW